MGVALRGDRMKVLPSSQRNKRIVAQPDFNDGEKIKELKARARVLLDEIINYEKQNFDDWPQCKDFLEDTRKELWNINARLK